MLYSYLFDGSKREDLETGLPNANGFIVMSQNGIVRCVEKNSCLLPTVRNCVQSRVILGDQSSIVHYFLNTDIFGAGVQNCEDLQEKLANEITPNLTTYAAI